MDKHEIEQQRLLRQQKERRKERLKTIGIVLLTVLFVVQIAVSGLLSPLPTLEHIIDQLFGQETDVAPPSGSRYTAATTPVRLSFRVPDGRYSTQYNTDVPRSLSVQSSELLREAVTSVHEAEVIRQDAYEQAYSMPGIWFDFLGVVPLHSVISWSQSIPTEPVLSAQISSLLLISSDETAYLYFSEHISGEYYRAKTDVRVSDINSLLEITEPNNVLFAFESDGYGMLDRETLIPGSPLEPAIFITSLPQTESELDKLLTTLSFYGQQGYTTSDGNSYREGGDTLHITERGDVYFETEGGSPRYAHPTSLASAIEITRSLANDALSSAEASILLTSIEEQADGSVAIYYSYCLHGIQVALGETGYAARFVVANGEITGYIMRPRIFSLTDTTSLVLPLPQAVAVLDTVSSGTGQVLELVYREQGDGSLQANWETVLP